MGVDHGHVVLVLHINVYVAGAIAGRLLRLAPEIDRADDGSVLGIDHGDVGGAVAEDVDALRRGFKQDSIRTALHVDRLDWGKSPGIPHDERLARSEEHTSELQSLR